MLFHNTEQERDSPFLFVVFGFPLPLRLCLLFLSQALPDGVCFRFLMEQICNISLAVKHHQRIVFLAVSTHFLCFVQSSECEWIAVLRVTRGTHQFSLDFLSKWLEML